MKELYYKPARAALVVIDLIEAYFDNGYLQENRECLIRNTNELIASARKNNIPIIWVKQSFKKDLSDIPLSNKKSGKPPKTLEGSAAVNLLPELDFVEGNQIVTKTRYNAFFHTELEDILMDELQVNTLIVAGVNTMTCIRTTAIAAYERDFEVILATDCVDGYDRKHHKASLEYMQYTVVQVASNEGISRWLSKL